MSDTTTHQLVVFSLGEEEYALPITTCRRSSATREPRTVASERAVGPGVISLRGKIIPVYDLAARLGLEREHEPGKIVIVERRRQAGVVVDDVEEVLTVDADQLEERPAAAASSIEAIAKVGDRLIVLLDPRRPVRRREVAEALAGRRPSACRGAVAGPASASSSPTTPAHAPDPGQRAAAPGFDVVGEAADGDEALAPAASSGPTR